MFHRGKLTQHRAAHPLGGRIRRNLLRVFPLQVLQAAQHVIILKIGDGWRILHIVAVTVGIQLLAKLLHFLLIIHVITRYS